MKPKMTKREMTLLMKRYVRKDPRKEIAEPEHRGEHEVSLVGRGIT